jgi:hypothetical protein
MSSLNTSSFMVLIECRAYRMKPTRIRMCHSLVMNYGLYKKMEIFVSGVTAKISSFPLISRSLIRLSSALNLRQNAK